MSSRVTTRPVVVFLRGVNVGGHRSFRPSLVAKKLHRYKVVNVGAAGTFVVHAPGARAEFEAALRRALPFEAQIAICDGRDVIGLETDSPFAARPTTPDLVRFVSILPKAPRVWPSLPIALPDESECLVRVIAAKRCFVFGEYRRHMKTIGCLGKLDEIFGAPATTRSWTTMLSIARLLRDPS
jgi:uncharacterized protein (DUF1697 family)